MFRLISKSYNSCSLLQVMYEMFSYDLHVQYHGTLNIVFDCSWSTIQQYLFHWSFLDLVHEFIFVLKNEIWGTVYTNNRFL